MDRARTGAPVPPAIVADDLDQDRWVAQIGRPECVAGPRDSTVELCRSGDPTSDVDVVVLGDSQAGMWLSAFDAIGRDHGYRITSMVKKGCSPFPVPQHRGGEPDEVCARFRAWALDRVTALGPHTVVVAQRALFRVAPQAGETAEEAWSAGARKGVRQLARRSQRVRVLGSTPLRHGAAPLRCVRSEDLTLADCLTEPDPEAIAGNRLLAEAVGAVTAEGESSFTDPLRYVCVDGACPLTVGEQAVYRDRGHLASSWVALLAEPLAEDLGLTPQQ